MLQNIFSHIKKKFLIDTHTKIGIKITEVPAGCMSRFRRIQITFDYVQVFFVLFNRH